MLMQDILPRTDRLSGTYAHLPRVVESLGEKQFGRDLLDLLGAACGAQHFALFRMTKHLPDPVIAASFDGTDTAFRQSSLYVSGSYWRNDAFFSQVLQRASQGSCSLGHVSTASMEARHRDRLYGATHIGERILLCGRTDRQALGLSILRTEDQGEASDDEMSCLQAISATLLSLLNKHLSLIGDKDDSSLALTSLREIERVLDASGVSLPKREVEVCARILFGITTAGIALDLGIGDETVVTYRKRSYQRLQIGSQRELLVWYLRQWSASRSTFGQLASFSSRETSAAF